MKLRRAKEIIRFVEKHDNPIDSGLLKEADERVKKFEEKQKLIKEQIKECRLRPKTKLFIGRRKHQSYQPINEKQKNSPYLAYETPRDMKNKEKGLVSGLIK